MEGTELYCDKFSVSVTLHSCQANWFERFRCVDNTLRMLAGALRRFFNRKMFFPCVVSGFLSFRSCYFFLLLPDFAFPVSEREALQSAADTLFLS